MIAYWNKWSGLDKGTQLLLNLAGSAVHIMKGLHPAATLVARLEEMFSNKVRWCEEVSSQC